MSWKKTIQNILLSIVVALGLPAVADAACASGAQTCSTSYQVNEAFFGSGGELNACSTTYCSKQSAGETGVGNTSSASYQAQAGFNTDRTPYIQMQVNTSSLDLGVLSTTTTKSASATFSVKTYLASGYVVTNASPPPTNGSYTMSAPSVPTASSTGSEQFGINLVSNSCPANNPSSGAGGCSGSLGAGAAQIPDSTFSFGKAADNTVNSPSTARYDQANQFMYRNGDVIAFSNKSSGETDYTISYLFNISATTPGGTYTMNHTIVATSTF